MSLDLANLAREASGSWAAAEGTFAELISAARQLKWKEVPVRSGEPAHAALKPRTRAEAKPHSLSATYGLDAQPLHTDGAHLSHPPDLIALVAEEANSTPTRLWTLRGPGHEGVPRSALLHGVFLVRSGNDRFLTTCSDGGRIRYDPGCMSPCDQRARAVVRFFEGAIDQAEHHHWDTNSTVLLIDNRTSLHARGAVAKVDAAIRTLHRVAFTVGEA